MESAVKLIEDITVITVHPGYEYLNCIVRYLIADLDLANRITLMDLLDIVLREDITPAHRFRIESLLSLIVHEQDVPPYCLYTTLQIVISRIIQVLISDSDSFPPQHGSLVDKIIENYGCSFTIATIALSVAHHIDKAETLLSNTIILPDNFTVLMEELTLPLMNLIDRDNWLLWFPARTNRYIRITLAMIKAIYLEGCLPFDEVIFTRQCIHEIFDMNSTIKFISRPHVTMMLLAIGLQLSKSFSSLNKG